MTRLPVLDMRARRSAGRRAVSAGLAVILALGVSEGVLGVLAWAFPEAERLMGPPWSRDTVAIPPAIPDNRLGLRPNPFYPGHDERGYRNDAALNEAHVVVLGDSQCYGTNVTAEDAWPRQLERLTQRSVYNMAFPGYGPAHGLVLWQDTLALKPGVIVQALYSGNDLYDSFRVVYTHGGLGDEIAADAVAAAAVARADASELFEDRIRRVSPTREGLNFFLTASAAPPAAPPRLPRSLREFLAAHSRVYGLARRASWAVGDTVQRQVENEHRAWVQAQAFARDRPEIAEVFSAGRWRTLFTPAYRSLALDVQDPRVAEGHRITLAVLQLMQERAADAGIAFVALLIPTKELVFSRVAGDHGGAYHTLVQRETAFWAGVKRFLDEAGIRWVDPLPALQEQLVAGPQPYPVTWDGHPNRYGHAAIARSVADALR